MTPDSNTLRFAIEQSRKEQANYPLWKGPCGVGPQGGVTQSLLGKFINCRARFAIYALRGLRPTHRFEHKSGYGNMWHACEEALAQGKPWKEALDSHCQKELARFQLQQGEIEKWYMVCKEQFPEYHKYWSARIDPRIRTVHLAEEVFDVPYTLSSGRIVRLRGKWDSADFIKDEGHWLQENKTKGTIDETQIRRQLTFDLQSMLYSTAYTLAYPQKKLVGVRYNVIRRPLSGGKGTIKQKKDETIDEYYTRLGDYIRAEPDTYFMRWEVPISAKDMVKFRSQCLDPLLEQMCHWYDVVALSMESKALPKWAYNYRTPYGIYNTTTEDRVGDYDEYFYNSSTAGLSKVKSLFTELEN